MKTVLTTLFLLISACFVLVACSKGDTGGDNPGACDGVPKNFAADVNPLIQTYCNQAACHNPGSINGPGPLTNYTEVFNARVAIRGQVLAGLMPQNTVLTQAQKSTIICWIDNGAPNN
jgi:hypothetical protein